MAKGKFITFEGADGSGKSTQAALLCQNLKDIGIDVILTREPGGAPGAEDIRTLLVEGEPQRWSPLSEVLLHYAARLEHVNHTISPALEGGTWVISDRFADSTMAYQGYGHQIGGEVVQNLHNLVMGDLSPDLTMLMNIEAHEGLERAGQRSGKEDRYERMDIEFHNRLGAGFLEIAHNNPDRFFIMSASGKKTDIAKTIFNQVQERFGLQSS